MNNKNESSIENENMDDKIYSKKDVEKILNKNYTFISIIMIIFWIFMIGLYFYEVNTIIDDKNIEKYLRVIELYKTDYINDVDIEDAVDYSIAGVVLSTEDKYGAYIPKDSLDVLGEKIQTGNYKGVGISYKKLDDRLLITDVIENSEAGRKGLKVGDEIIEIDGNPITKFLIDEYEEKLITGSIDSIIYTLSDGKKVNINIGLVIPSKLDYRIKDNTAFISIHNFVAETINLFKDSLIDISKNKNINNIVIDLRNNSGGDVEVVTEMLNFLIDDGLIVDLKYKNGKEREVNATSDILISKDIPIQILVNENTASASELFTMTLQDYRNSKVIGEKTFGKSTILTYYTFEDGSILVMSTGTYYPKSGRDIEGIGIEPDIVLNEEDLNKSVEMLYQEGII